MKGQPFTEFSATLSHEFKQARNYLYQFYLDGWAGGTDPYLQFRLEGCRRKGTAALNARVCLGLGAYHAVNEKGISPSAAMSVTGELWKGRINAYGSWERAFVAPTFTYYQGEVIVVACDLRHFKLSAGVLSRSIQRAAGKVAITFSPHVESYASLGDRRATVGMAFSF